MRGSILCDKLSTTSLCDKRVTDLQGIRVYVGDTWQGDQPHSWDAATAAAYLGVLLCEPSLELVAINNSDIVPQSWD